MLKNYFTIAFRNIIRQKSSALLNVTGLTLGITASIILFLLIKHFTSFDTIQSNYNRIYRVVSSSDGNTEKEFSEGVPSVLPPAFRLDFPEAEEVTFTQYNAGAIVLVPQKNSETKKFSEEAGVVFAESNFFKIFDRTIIIGDAAKSLDDPNEAIISKALALKYFGREDVIGEIVKFGDHEFRISAVMVDPPSNTNFPFTLMLSYETIRKKNEEKGWNSTWSDEHCYFLLKEDESISKVESRMADFLKKHATEANYDHKEFLIQPLQTLHSDERFGNYSYNTVSSGNLLALVIIAIFLLATACINFINLATAEAIKRSKEVGIRKTLGSSRLQLIMQFLGETGLVTFIAMLCSLGFVQIALGFLNPFLEIDLSVNLLADVKLAGFIIAVFFGVSLLSGMYPALILSGYKPVLALKNAISNRNSSGFMMRKGLVVVQFFISQFFIIGTIVLISQMNYMRNKDLGFRKDAIINISIPEEEVPATDSTGLSKMRTLSTEIMRLSGVEKVSLNSFPPASGSVFSSGFILEGEGKDKRKDTQVKLVDGNYIDLFGLTLIAGQNIEDFDTARSILVNRKLTLLAGFTTPQEMIGRRIRVWGQTLPVVGVIEDFHTTSLQNEVEATVLFNRIKNYQTLSVSVNQHSFQTTLPEIQDQWEAAYSNNLFEYEFLDESIRKFYEGEERISVLIGLFTTLAIVIGCLGLFGLATFMANQKNKEIGVRKVLGASAESIVWMFSREFAVLVLIGFVLAAPASWYVMNEWLSEFAYRIELKAWIFLAGVGITLLIAVFTVGYRSLKAATTNPVKSLRYE